MGECELLDLQQETIDEILFFQHLLLQGDEPDDNEAEELEQDEIDEVDEGDEQLEREQLVDELERDDNDLIDDLIDDLYYQNFHDEEDEGLMQYDKMHNLTL